MGHFLKAGLVPPKTPKRGLQQERGKLDTWKDFLRGRLGKCLGKGPES